MRIGIDLGGTKIAGIVLADDGTVVAEDRTPTPRGEYRPILEAVAGTVHALEDKAGEACSIGIGTPGAVSPASGLLRNSNSTELNDRPVLSDLQALLDREIRIANDANCFALSEATDGAAAGADVVFGVIVGTGTGAGVVVNGRVLTGPNAIAGEWGHNPLPWPRDDERPGADCYCGRQGCIETFISGTGFERDYAVIGGEAATGESIVRLAGQGDAAAETAMRRYEDRMARAMAHVINILDPDVIVLGGGMSNVSRLYQTVPQLWGDYVFSDVVNTRLTAPGFGDASGVRGAAWLWE